MRNGKALLLPLFLLVVFGVVFAQSSTKSVLPKTDYLPLIFSGVNSREILDEVSALVRGKPSAKATWILNCEDLSSEDPSIRSKVLELQNTYGDAVGYSLRHGMGLASGAGAGTSTSEDAYHELDQCFTQFKDYFGSYPILHLWISDIGILKHIKEKYGSEIAITSNWQQYKTDTISSAGSFDYPYYPSLNHPIVPGKDNYIDILNYEVEHPDLYWAKVSGTRPVFEPVNADSLDEMDLLMNSVFRESNFNNDQIRVLPSIIELGFIYSPATPNNNNLEKVKLLKDWLSLMFREYPNINHPNLHEFNRDFRKQQDSNSKSYALLQSGTNGAWSSYAYPARSQDYKIFMFWSQHYRSRLALKVGKGGYIRLTDYTPYSDRYQPERSPQDISIYQGMNFVELDNIGLKEELVYKEGALQLNFPRTSDLDHEVNLESVKKDGETYILEISINIGPNKVVKTISFSDSGIKYYYEWVGHMPLKINYETFKATYNLTNRGISILPGEYSPADIIPTARSFVVESNQTLGNLDVLEIKQGHDTPLEWSSSNEPFDNIIPTDFSSLVNSVTIQGDGYVNIAMREYE